MSHEEVVETLLLVVLVLEMEDEEMRSVSAILGAIPQKRCGFTKALQFHHEHPKKRPP